MTRNVFERSANRNNGNNVANCNTSGNLNNNNANNGNYCAPDRVNKSRERRPPMGNRGQRDARSRLPEGESPEQRSGPCAPVPRDGGASAARTPDIEDVIGIDALWDSMDKCLTGSRWKGRPAYWQMHAAEMLAQLCDELHAGTYEPKPTVSFQITRPKPREILATDFRDRVVQRSFNDNLIYPVMSRSWIYDSYACQKGKGTDFARRRLRAHLERHVRAHGTEGWVLQMDIRGYYRNMRHDVCEARFEAKLPDWGTAFVKQTFRHQYHGPTGYNPGSQMVQIAGIDYLDPLDHRMKERMRAKAYGRYMDDLFVIAPDRAFLEECLTDATTWLATVGLEPHPTKTHIRPVTEPMGFLGFDFRVTPDCKVLMLAQPAKVKEVRRDVRKLAGLVAQGRMTREQFDASNQCRLAHLSKCDNRGIIEGLEEYIELTLKGAHA